ncbi:MAG: hypothetical protein AB1478_07830 [Nitrospirota bacterium]
MDNEAVEQCPGGASVSNSWFSPQRSGGGNIGIKRSKFTGGIKTPDMKLTEPVLRTKECCHEHAGEIFNI